MYKKKASLLILGFALLLLTTSCSCRREKTIINDRYSSRLEALNTAFESESYEVDQTFEYKPGVVLKPLPEEIITDPVTGIKTVNNEYIIQLKKGKTDRHLIKALKRKRISCTVTGYVPTFLMVQVKIEGDPATIINQISKLKVVTSIEQSFIIQTFETNITTDLPAKTGLWHLDDFEIPSIWQEATGKEVTIAICDTGIDLYADAFTGRIKNPWSVVTGSQIFEDDVYYTDGDLTHVVDHGTKVAGIAAGSSLQPAKATGVARDAYIMPIQVVGFCVEKEQILTSDIMVIEGIARAIAFKADIINISIGTDYSSLLKKSPGPSDLDDTTKEIMTNHVTRVLSLYDRPFTACEERNIAIVCAAGNDSLDAAWQPLAAHRYTIAVGAITRHDGIAPFSNTGKMIDCYAPGADIATTGSGGSIRSASGTSFSAPYVSGLIALCRQHNLYHFIDEIKHALSESNFEARMSILDRGTLPLFYPVEFYQQLGGDLSTDNSVSTIEAWKTFHQNYKKYYIYHEDSDRTKLEKILGYYTKLGYIDTDSDREATTAIILAPAHFDWLLETAADASKPADYYAAMVLGDTSLSDQQLQQVRSCIMRNDMVSIICNYHNDSQALPVYYKRLTAARWYNGNTMYGILKFQDDHSFTAVRNYLNKIQKTYTEFQNDEHIASYTLSCLVPEAELTEVKKMIYNSYSRFNSASYGTSLHTVKQMQLLGEALINTRQREGLSIITVALTMLDSQENIARSGSSTSPEYFYKKLQKLLNTNTDFSVLYDYQIPLAERKDLLRQINTLIQRSTWENGKFRTTAQKKNFNSL